MESGNCPCEGMEKWDLALCLAPPRGEYELEYSVGPGTRLVVNRDGVFLRQTRPPEALPFMETIERRVGWDALEAKGIDAARVVCDSIRALERAAASGSRYARSLLEACSSIISLLSRECLGGEDGGEG
ncbi:MAG: hypothetical protein F7C34_02940 [Desulfurococcales archaeon]|nr:hypothetical protein [Desulfurococcales archaeon]